MRTKGDLPTTTLTGSAPTLPPLVEAYIELNNLKVLFRQGWLRRGVPEARCESVAEHVFSMAVLGWWILDAAFPELDPAKVLRMTLVHELGEIYIGDIVPADGVDPLVKYQREREGFIQVTGKLPKASEYLTLWEEFERGETPEARFVRQLDRLEMGFQALVHERQGIGEMDQFFASAEAAQQDPRMRETIRQMLSAR
jgi:putative hydrolase of HD superfamily